MTETAEEINNDTTQETSVMTPEELVAHINSLNAAAEIENEVKEENNQHENSDGAEEELPEENKTDINNDIQSSAKNAGWMDKESWVKLGNDAEDWVDANEYMRQLPFRQHLRTIKNDNKQLRQAINELVKIQTQMNERQLANDSETIEAQIQQVELLKDEAIENGEKEKVRSYEKYIYDLKSKLESTKTAKENLARQKPPEPEKALPPETQKFIDDNPWFTENSSRARAMREYAITREQELSALHPTKNLSEIFKLLQTDVNETFGLKPAANVDNTAKLRNDPKHRPAPVEGNTSRATSMGAQKGVADFTPEQRKIYQALPPYMRDEWLKMMQSNNLIGHHEAPKRKA